jgi:hypothetical protein
MERLREITVLVPTDVLEKAQAYTGEDVEQTVIAALRHLASVRAQQELLKLRGKVKFSISHDDIKRERD